MRDPLHQNHWLDRFLEQDVSFDYVIANGDYSCDCASLGISDEAAYQSTRECVEKLRRRFGAKLRANFGDHDLGKISFVGDRGGMRVASWHRAQRELGLQPFWSVEIGRYVLLGITSSLVALPVYEADILPAERTEWEQLRADHLAEIGRAFAALQAGQRVLLFCHDPTALPFLGRQPEVSARLPQIEQTIIGHLHTNLVLWKSKMLAGMPVIGFLGPTGKRMSTALCEARHWRPFHVRLCPSLAGIELWRRPGYLAAELDPEAARPGRFRFRRLPRA